MSNRDGLSTCACSQKKRIERLGRIGVLMGGSSSESKISLKSGHAIYEALKNYGCQVKDLVLTSQNEDELFGLIEKNDIEIVFLALHGRFGEDGSVQALLEKMGVVYTGSGIEASQRAINKAVSQEIFQKNQITVPSFIVLRKDRGKEIEKFINERQKFPVVVKPTCEGSSIGVGLVNQKSDLASAIEHAFQFDPEIIIEDYISGRELTVGILGQQALPVIEIRAKNKFFDFSAKYESGTTEYIVPAPMPESVSRKVQESGLRAYQSLGCRDLSRVDIMLSEEQIPYVLEINTIPGFTATSLLPKAARAVGIDFSELCLKILELAYGRKK